MQASRRTRERELQQVFQNRRGHAPQISISDDSHHVTEAIGGMYGDDDDYESQPKQPRSPRPLSFIPSPLGDTLEGSRTYFDDDRSPSSRIPLTRTPSNERRGPIHISPGSYAGSQKGDMSRHGSFGSVNGQGSPGNSQMSPSGIVRSPSESAQQQFEITDLDSTAAVAQELSNLQAIRRMSMDVNGVDPDLPSFSSGWNVPAVAPSPHSDDEDPSRLFWVPASVHPELAPTAFKTFIQDRVKTIKRSSLSEDALSPSVGQDKGGLRRKKSMLSRQVNDANGYQDGAERLEHKRSSSGMPLPIDQGQISMQELEHLVNDPSSLVKRMSADSSRDSLESLNEGNSNDDKPILAPKPPGQTLKRSTRTTYRRGSQRKGSALGKRRGQETEHDEMPQQPSPTKENGIPQLPALPDLGQFGGQFGLTRVQTEPVQPKKVENFSRPGRRAQTPPTQQSDLSHYDYNRAQDEHEERPHSTSPEQQPFQSRISSNGRSTVSTPPNGIPVPIIVETPPPSNDFGRVQSLPVIQRPERSSSIEQPQSQPPKAPLPGRPSQQRPPLTRPATLQNTRQGQQKSTNQTEFDMAQHPTPLPGGVTRTDELTMVPFAQEKKAEKKSKDKKDDGSRKTSWNWFLSSDEKEKEKEKEQPKKGKQKIQKPQDRSHDNTRLDVLQSSIEGKGRESLVLDRQTVHVEQDKRQGRKTSNEGKKEKESGIFSSLFGGGKKKGDKESGGKKSGSSLRGLSPDPPQKRLHPDVDYNWSRFSILEERAIYRMAHMKLANPRRELYSQVLLSNFMYSYLAKVQQMHPQIQIPQSAAQKQQQRQAQQQKKAEQQRQEDQQRQQSSSLSTEELAQYQRYQEQQANLDSSNSKPGPASSKASSRTGTPSPDPPPAEEQQSRPNSRAAHHKQGHHSSSPAAASDMSQTTSYSSTNGNYSVSSATNYLGLVVDPTTASRSQQPLW